MKGFHVEEPALHLDIPSVFNLLGHEHAMFSPHFKHEGLSLTDYGGKLQPPPISSSSHSINKASTCADERGNYRWPNSGYGGLAENNNWGINALGNMVVPVTEKKKNDDDYVCRGIPHMGKMEGNMGTGVSHGFVGNEGDHHAFHTQASIAAPFKGDHMLGFTGFVGNDAKHVSNFQESIAALSKGGAHLGRFGDRMGNEGIYVNDLQASMVPLMTCDSPPGDNSLWRFLPSNNEKHSMDLISSDEFCMYEFKVRRCMRGRSHDWTECPYAHPGEKARRRDPRCFHYSGTACPDFRRGTCRRGDSCELSHGVFECWLHPARYRTQLCKDGKACKRRVCFFAHSPSQLRIVSPETVSINDQFSLKMSLASSTDAMSLTKRAMNSYGADGIFEDFSPKSMHSFPTDGRQDGMNPLSAHRHSFNHSKSVPLDGVSLLDAHRHSLNHIRSAPLDKDFESYMHRNSYGHHGMSFNELSNRFELNSNGDYSHGYFSAANGVLLADDYGYESSSGHSYSTPSSPLYNSSIKADANFRSQLALSSLKGSLDQLMSPTSTLIGHVASPPPLSPPLSPSESPPMSPGAALSNWNSALSRKIASLTGHPQPHDAFAQSPASGVDGNHTSLLANLASGNYGSCVPTSTRGPSPLSTISNGDQTHNLDRSHALQPVISKDECVMDANLTANAMEHLISTLQQIELRRAAMMEMKSKRRSSFLLQRMQSPKSRLEGSYGDCSGAHALLSHQRDESGQGLRGKFNGSLAKEEMESLDFGWVNELVK